MVLINSDRDDQSTNEVIDWIALTKTFEVLRSSNNTSQRLYLDDEKLEFSLNDIELDEVKSFWYRRGGLFTSSQFLDEFDENCYEQEYIDKIKSHVKLDVDRLSQYGHIYFLSSKKKTLGNYPKSKVNKISTLCLAKEAGLSIPKTIITTKKSDLLATFGTADFITKPVGETGVYPIKNDNGEFDACIYTYTALVHLDDLNEDFHVSLFQEKIEKKFEVRTFVLGKELYSMAIFSQDNEQTEVDFRNYDFDVPNRAVPYQLPKETERKVLWLLEKSGLDTGSIDFLITKENKIVFLEINPVGQFGMVSLPCNYNLEKKIADYLTAY